MKDLRSFLGKKPVLALTATANKSLRQRLSKALGFKGNKELIISPNKENIRFTVMEADKSLSCFNWLVDMIKEKKADTPHTIIFCHTVSDIVMVLSTLLMKLGKHAYLEGGEEVPDQCILSVYYSATPDSAKNRVTSSFTGSGSARVVIASTSLSMGVDFPHVRYVIHFGPGRTLVDHLQQAGRAGRDSKSAYNVIMYLGKHLGQCEGHIRDVIKKQECVRKLIFCHFTDNDVTLTPMHDCCNRCHILCKCDGDKCTKSSFPFDKLPSTTEEAEKVRQVNDDDKTCLNDALQEIKQSLSSCTRATFFDTSGVLCHGFSDSIIKSIVDNSHKIFTLTDLLETSFISSLQLAVMVLEVFSELFEDIIIDTSLYKLAVDSGPVYNELMDNAEHEIDLEQWSDDDANADC